VDSLVAYIADPDDRVSSGGQLVLVARTDYGSTGFRPGQTNGTFSTNPPQQTASASTSIPLGVLFCGDGIVNLDEFCDDGNTNNDDACRNDCTACGDGVLQTGEVCDDGNNTDHDGCDANCQPEECAVNVDKQVSCDGTNWFDVGQVLNNEDGTLGPIPGCNVNDPVFVRYQASNVGEVNVQNCTLTESSSVINPGGTVQSGFSIGFGVTLPPLNADGNQNCTDALEAQEPDTASLTCECVQPSLPPGNAQASDTATVECVPICGDGIVGNTPGETCDPPGSAVGSPGETCRNDCTYCGDNVVNSGEACDDGNEINNDSCRNDCTLPDCGDGIVDAGEECDDGNTNNNDGCRNDCTLPFCGDGILDPGEQCDDGNNTDGDGCSATCEEEGDFAGCTPGFWKQPHHLIYWTTYSPDDLYDVVFGVTWMPELTLLDALRQGGGGAIALGRHSVAALLNSASPEVDYAYSTAAIIQFVQDAHASGDFQFAHATLAAENERGCTVDKSGDNKVLSGSRSQIGR
jgi:cysteine-rich repeat protein